MKKHRILFEVLKGFSYVKMKPLSSHKAKVLEDIKEAVEQMKLIEKAEVQENDCK